MHCIRHIHVTLGRCRHGHLTEGNQGLETGQKLSRVAGQSVTQRGLEPESDAEARALKVCATLAGWPECGGCATPGQ